MKNTLQIVGVTECGMPVLSGVLRFEQTNGLPLEIILEHMQERGIVPSWYHVMAEARNSGANMDKFMQKLAACVVAVYGKPYWENIRSAL